MKIFGRDLRNLRNPQKVAKYVANAKKSFRNAFRHSVTAPIFVLGLQRSGTTLLMDLLHRHPDTKVYDEKKRGRVFLDFQVRSLQIIREAVRSCRVPAVVFKTIADSHKFDEFSSCFPDARFVWALRNYKDNAESRLGKFENATRAVRLVVAGESGGGWFAEGASEAVRECLQGFSDYELSEFDYACLVWWARNQIFFEYELENRNDVWLLNYDEFVSEPREYSSRLFGFMGLQFDERLVEHVHSRSVGSSSYPRLDPDVEKLCENSMQRFRDVLDARRR
jgi:hypothetical protein